MGILTRLKNEPLVILGVLLAGVNTATDQSWKGYVVAVIVALARFVVYGPVTGTVSKNG